MATSTIGPSFGCRALVATPGPRCPPWLPWWPQPARASAAVPWWPPAARGARRACRAALVASTGPSLGCRALGGLQRPEVPAVPAGLPWWSLPARASAAVPWWPPPARGARVAAGLPWWPPPPELRLLCPGGLYRPEEQPTRRVLPTPHLTSSVRKPTHPTRYGK